MNQLIKFCVACVLFTLAMSSVVHADERTVHVVEPGDSVYRISVEYNITIEDIEAWNDIVGGVIHPGDELYVSPPNGESSESDDSTAADESETDTDENATETVYVPTIVPHAYPPETHVHLQNILNQFSDFPMLAQVEMLQEDSEYARINLEKDFNNSPLGRVVILAYTLNMVERGALGWDQEFEFTEDIEGLKTLYPLNMPESDDSTFTNGSFTLRELVEGTLDNDVNAFYLLLHHIGFSDTADLNVFISNTTGNQFTLNVSVNEIHEFLTYIYNHNDQTIIEIWQEQDGNETVIGSEDATMFQLFAENDNAQYVTGIISGDTNYVVTVIIERLETHDVDGIASRIYNNHDIEVDSDSYALNEIMDNPSQFILRYAMEEMDGEYTVRLENF